MHFQRDEWRQQSMRGSVSPVPDHLVPLFLDSLRPPPRRCSGCRNPAISPTLTRTRRSKRRVIHQVRSLSLSLSLLSRAAAMHGRSQFHSTLPAPLWWRPPSATRRRNRNKLHATFPQQERGRLCCRMSNGISYNITNYTNRTMEYTESRAQVLMSLNCLEM